MKWIKREKNNKHYFVCLVANDHGISASRLNSRVQEEYRIHRVQCGTGKLTIDGESIDGEYDFFIVSEDERALYEAKKKCG